MISTARAVHLQPQILELGEVRMRWPAAGMVEVESRFYKVPGSRSLATITITIERGLYRRRHYFRQAVTTTVTM
jgi:hypothetical protein